jgi:hypothetical protein
VIPDERRPAWWPRNPQGYVFLAEAIGHIGRTRFQDWTGSEPDTEDVPLLPASLAAADHWAKGHAERLLAEHSPDLSFPRYPLSGPEFTNEQWSAAIKLARRLHDERQPALERLRFVHDKTLAPFEDGSLISAVREHNGNMRECPRRWWNGDGLERRLKRCKLNPDDPFDRSRLMSKDDDYLWIFVTAATLNLLLARLGASEQTLSILEATSSLWPLGVPSGIRAKERREEIARWLKNNGRHVPTDEALDTAIQRALKGATKGGY